MRPMSPTPRARCSSTLPGSTGTRRCSRLLRSRARYCRRCATPAPITAQPRRICSARRSRLPPWSATSRRRCSARLAFARAWSATYGTGAFALVNLGPAPVRSRHRLLTTIGYRLGGRTAYALEGSIFVVGAAVQWLRDRLGLITTAAETGALAAAADPRQRLYLVPGFAGLGAPYWAPQARGALIGLTAECGPAEIARAALEAVGYQTRDLMTAIAADSGIAPANLRVDGGMAASDWTMQFLADILPAPVERPALVETTAWGAAYAAGLTRGLYPDPAALEAGW